MADFFRCCSSGGLAKLAAMAAMAILQTVIAFTGRMARFGGENGETIHCSPSPGRQVLDYGLGTRRSLFAAIATIAAL